MAIAESLILQVKADTGKAVSNMNKFTKSTKQGTSAMSGLIKKIAATVISLYAVKKAFTFAKESAMVAAQADQIRAALDNMAKRAGTSADEIVRKMQEMSGGTIDQLRIMESASKAALLGIPLERMDELMKVARASATALGTDVGQMFNDLATGIGRQSKMILDNLGINISAEKAYKRYAVTLGKTVDQLTDAERKQGFLNAVLEDGKRIMEEVGEAGANMTATEPWQIMTAAIMDAKIALGENLFPLFNEGALKVAKMVRDMVVYLEDLPKTFEVISVMIQTILRETFSWNMIKANVVDMARGYLETIKESIMLQPKIVYGAIRMTTVLFENLFQWLIHRFSNVWLTIRNAAVDKMGDLLAKIGIEIEKKAIPAVQTFGEMWDITISDIEAEVALLGRELGMSVKDTADAYGEMLARLAENYKDNPAYQEALAQLTQIKEEADAAATALAAGAPGTPAAPEGGEEKAVESMTAAYDRLRHAEEYVNQEYLDITSNLRDGTQENIKNINFELDAWKNMYAEEARAAEVVRQARLQIEEEITAKVLEEAEKQKQAKQQVAYAAVNTMQSMFSAIGTMRSNALTAEMAGLDKESEEYKKLARQRARDEKNMAIMQATINTAVAVTKALTGAVPPFNFILAGLATAAGAAQIAAINSTPLPALAEGGIVDKPTVALIGERGPEAVIPLGRGRGAAPVIVVNVAGSVLTEEGIARKIGSIWRRQNRGY